MLLIERREEKKEERVRNFFLAIHKLFARVI
jgi:hypothetical protein